MDKYEQIKELEEKHGALSEKELEELLEKKSKEKTRAILDRALRFLGLVLATILFLVTFSAMSPLTWFAFIFKLKAREVWLDSPGLASIFEPGSIYHSVIGGSPGAAIFIMTLLQIMLFAGLALLISFYIRDVINVAKDVFGIGKGITKEFTSNVREGLDETGVSKVAEGIKNPFTKKKKLFEESEEKTNKKVEKLKKEIADINNEAKPEVKPEPVVEVSTKVELTQKELDKKIDEILNDQSLSYEEAQTEVAKLQSGTVIVKDKKKLF